MRELRPSIGLLETLKPSNKTKELAIRRLEIFIFLRKISFRNVKKIQFFNGDITLPTDEECCSIWKPIGDKGIQRFCP